MAEKEETPKFVQPGENPELDKVLEALKTAPAVGRGHDVFGRPLRRTGAAAKETEGKAAAAEAKPAAGVGAGEKGRGPSWWMVLGAVALGVPLLLVGIGALRSRGPTIVLGPAPASMSGAPTGEVKVVPGPTVSTTASAVPSASASASAASAGPAPRSSAIKKKAPAQGADAGATPAPVSTDFLE